MSQKNLLQIGDLVWYNVGGRGYETMGLVVETSDLWRSASPWESTPKKYSNCIRIQWMRKGKLVPRHLAYPLFKTYWAVTDYKYPDGSFAPEGTFPARRIDKSVLLAGDDWYEGQFFKVVGSANTRRK